jgi:hypothetical protein
MGNEVKSNIISIFLLDGTFELGIRELMDKDRDAWKFDEVEAGYIFDNKFCVYCICQRVVLDFGCLKRELEEIPGAGFTVEGPGRRARKSTGSPAGRQGAAVGARISPAAVIAPPGEFDEFLEVGMLAFARPQEPDRSR